MAYLDVLPDLSKDQSAAMKDLSSIQTFLMKSVFPVIWISGWGAGTVALWFGAMTERSGMQPPAETKWIFLFALIFGVAIIWWACAPLKRVWLDGMVLHASNYLQEIAMPVAAIGRVTENRWTNVCTITIHFNRSTLFGDSIVFMPKARLFAFWSPHPVIAELEELAMTVRMRSAEY
ncbi:MAG: hypothetical protein ABIO49_05830 [Dokdonella sp.]